MILRPRIQSRHGLGGAGARLAARPGKIGYFGASVTLQRTGYSPRLHEQLCRLWGHDHRRIAAGTGVGSLSGAFLADELVVRHRPDLCFVEYFSGDLDGRTPPDCVGPAVESIVEKLLTIGCTPCLLYLHRRDIDFTKPNPVLAAYEEVAEHHGIPSIDLSLPFQEGAARGELELGELLSDVVHTTPTGSQLVADAVLEMIRDLSASVQTSPAAPRRRLRASLHGGRYRRATVAPADIAWLRHPARARRGRFRLVLEYVLIDPGNPVEVRLDDEVIGVHAILGSEPVALEVQGVNGVEQVTVWNPEARHDHLGTAIFKRGYPAGQPVRIKVVGERSGEAVMATPMPRIRPELRLVGLLVR